MHINAKRNEQPPPLASINFHDRLIVVWLCLKIPPYYACPQICIIIHTFILKRTQRGRQLLNRQCQRLVGIKGRQRRRWRQQVAAGAGAEATVGTVQTFGVGEESRGWFDAAIDTASAGAEATFETARTLAPCRASHQQEGLDGLVIELEKKKRYPCVVVSFFSSVRLDKYKRYGKWFWWISAFELYLLVATKLT